MKFSLLISLLATTLCLLLLNGERGSWWVHSQQAVFQQFGSIYSMDTSVKPAYYIQSFLNSAQHGYIELTFMNVSNNKCSYKVESLPSNMLSSSVNVYERERKVQSLIQLTLLNNCEQTILGENSAFLKIVFTQEYTKNIDPYTTSIFKIYRTGSALLDPEGQLETVYYGFKPWDGVSSSNSQNLGPYETTIDLFQVWKEANTHNYIFGIYAYDSTKERLNSNVPIYYPRDLVYDLYNSHDFSSLQSLTLTYNSIPVLPIKDSNPPTVSVSLEDTWSVGNALHGSSYDLVLRRLRVREENVKLGQDIIEERSFWFAYESSFTLPSGDKVQLDLNAITCAYDYGNGQPLIFDTKVSLLEVKNRRFLLICRESNVIGSYSLLIVGKQMLENRKQVNVEFNTLQNANVNTIYQYSYVNSDYFLLSFNQNASNSISGQFNLVSNSIYKYSNMKSPQTNQKPLTLFSVITLDLTNIQVINSPNLDINQRVSFTFSNSIKDGVDPSSLRVALLNESSNTFDLYLGDDDIMGIRSWTYGISIGVTKSLTFGLYYYSNNIGMLGEGQIMTYSRSLHYQLDSMISLTMKYEMSDSLIRTNVDSKYKPYLVVSDRKVNTISNQGNYTILKSLTIESGNGLGSLKLKDSRTFRVNSTTKISDINGNLANVNLLTMKCAYLFKESQYSIMELGNSPQITPSSEFYQLNCLEDIRDEDYVLLLVVVPFQTIVEKKDSGKDYVINPSVISQFDSLWSDKDLISVQFSPDSNFNGTFSFGFSNSVEFTKVPSLQDKQPLQVIYSLDLNIQDPPKSGFFGYVLLTLSPISVKFNLDPYSFRLMKLDKDSKEMKLLYDDIPFRGPWEVKVVPLETKLSFKLAISYNYRLPATMQRQYLINYARKLDYFLQPTEIITFTFQIPSLSPLTVSDIPTFKLEDNASNIRNLNIPSYEILHSLQITQENVRQYELKPERHLTFFKSHVFTNLEGTRLPNLNISTLTCAFILPGSSDVIISKAAPIELAHDYDLSCGEHFWGQTYSLFIIGKLISTPPTPQPSVSSITKEVAQHLVRNSTVSSTIGFGQTKLFSVPMKSNEKLTLLFSSFTGSTRLSNGNLQLFIGIDFVPTATSFSYQLGSNEILEQFIEVKKDGFVYFLLVGPSVSGNSIPFTLSPKIYTSNVISEPIASPQTKSSIQGNMPKESHDNLPLIIVISLLSTALLVSICVGIACGIYQRKKQFKMDQYDRYEKELMSNQK